MEEQLQAITKQLTNLGPKKAPSNPKSLDSQGSDASPFHWKNSEDDYSRHEKLKDQGDNHNLKMRFRSIMVACVLKLQRVARNHRVDLQI